jgi:hypothetical protein
MTRSGSMHRGHRLHRSRHTPSGAPLPCVAEVATLLRAPDTVRLPRADEDACDAAKAGPGFSGARGPCNSPDARLCTCSQEVGSCDAAPYAVRADVGAENAGGRSQLRLDWAARSVLLFVLSSSVSRASRRGHGSPSSVKPEASDRVEPRGASRPSPASGVAGFVRIQQSEGRGSGGRFSGNAVVDRLRAPSAIMCVG